MTYLIPIVVQIPVTALITDAVEINCPQTLDLTDITGSLQALVSGTFSVEVRRATNASLIGTLSWIAAGAPASVEADRIRIDAGDRLRFDVVSLGIGAAGCYVTLWAETA